MSGRDETFQFAHLEGRTAGRPQMHLPDELLESIFSYIHEKSTEPTPESQQTFAALALTSKRFLPLARSYLYYRPIPRASAATWAQALALYSSLSTPLGQLVLSLEGIIDYVAEIGTLAEPGRLAFQLRGFTKAFSFYHAIIDSCPQLVKVELIFNSQQHGSKLMKALAKSQSTLKTVRFANPSNTTTYRITAALIRWSIGKSQLNRVENLIVDNIHVDLETSAQPSTNLALKSCTIIDVSSSTIKGLLPQDPTSLESVSFGTWALKLSDVTWLLKYLPNSLKKFNLGLYDYRTYLPSFDDYLRTNPLITPADFAHFTSLTHLSLQSLDGPSLDLLDVLASSSGSTLAVLDLRGSKWIPSRSASNVVPVMKKSFISFIVDPEDLLEHLRQFQKLQRVHLGFLPTLQRQTYANLAELKEEKGIEIDWECSARYSICVDCGSRHPLW
ncbi:uncharacterized protein JCM6883_001203 [Sporobolomyces salmoneus]|uniref:uncharacterized protein n=1 Tax=Sporobolomyces salmoneus TaxID=183962 RepID=UPI00317E43EC